MKILRNFFIFFLVCFIRQFFLFNCSKEKSVGPEAIAQNIKTALFTNDGSKLTKIIPDNRKILWQQGDFTFKQHFISVDSTDGSCWIASSNSNQKSSAIYKFAANGDEMINIPGFHNLKGISVNSNTGNCAIIDSINAKIHHLIVVNKNSEELFRASTLNGYPFYCLSDNNIWVAGVDSSRKPAIHVYSQIGGLEKQFSDFGICYDLSFDYKRGLVWLAITGVPNAINIIDFDGNLIFEKTVIEFSGFSNIQSVAVDGYNGSCWIADSGNEQIVNMANNGDINFIVAKVGFSSALEIDPQNRNCYIALPDLDKILVTDSFGKIKYSITNLESPVNLSIIHY